MINNKAQSQETFAQRSAKNEHFAQLEDGVALGLSTLALASEFTGLGEAYDGTVGLGIAVGSLVYDVWDLSHE